MVSSATKLIGGTAIAALLCANTAAAGARCADSHEMTALKVAAVQQQLMVAALACHQVDEYNRFVMSYQPELQKSDRTLLQLFVRRNGLRGDADYNAFKTNLANTSSMRSISAGENFCTQAKAEFDLAQNGQESFLSFVSAYPLYVQTPIQECGEIRVVATTRYNYEDGANHR